jgi:hypothetical protein
MSVNEGKVVAHVAKGEGWEQVASTGHRGAVTRTYAHWNLGVLHVRHRVTSGEVVGLSWINDRTESPATILASDDYVAIAIEVLMGERK